jgi:ribosomal protein S4
MIVHRHVMIGDRCVDRPGYWVQRGEEDKITLA